MIDYDLVIVGAGSGNMLPMAEIEGLRVAIIERDRFGGTCLNRGCIPSKMLVHTADVAETVRTAGRYGIRAELLGADWPAIRDRVFTRLDQSAADGLEYRAGQRRRRVPRSHALRRAEGAAGRTTSSSGVSG